MSRPLPLPLCRFRDIAKAAPEEVSLNRWVFKWRLKMRMLSRSQMSADREFQVHGAATEKARRASSVCTCMRGTTSSGASEERRARGGAWVWLCEPCVRGYSATHFERV